jgi:phosphoribosyl-ATP pyrophosphohydrolase/phosphoribosyl-AMP cyclohydrolase
MACKSVKFGADGLIPAIVQDVADGAVLMVAYMNRESLALSLQTGRTWFYSRSRQSLWQKGATSGHFQYIREVLGDCDQDALLVKVDQVGVACHEGYRSCFFRQLTPAGWEITAESASGRQLCASAGMAPPGATMSSAALVVDEASNADAGSEEHDLDPAPTQAGAGEDILDLLFAVIRDRQRTLPENSYTTHLFQKGIDRIAQKVGEEAVEVVIAGKNRDRDEIVNESADLVYHLLVLLAECDVSLDDIRNKLAERRQ